MKQIKKYAIPLALAGVLFVALITWFLFLKSSNVYDAIPRSAVAVIEVNDWNKFYEKLATTTCGTELKKTDVAIKLKEELAVIGNILSADKSFATMVNSGKTVASLHLSSAEDFDYLFTASADISDRVLLNLLNGAKTVRAVKIRNFRNQQVYDVALADGKQITFATKNGIFIFSFTSFLTESAVMALISGDNTGSNRDFNDVRKRITEPGDFKLFFNFKSAATIMPVFMKREKTSLLADVNSYASWAGYAVVLSNEEVKLTGIASGAPKSTLPVNKNVLASNLLANIPDNAACVNIGLNTLNGTDDNSAANKMLASYFKDWAGDVKAFVTLEPLQEDYSDQNIFMIEVRDQSKALSDLKRLMKDDSPESTPETFNGLPIYNIAGGAGINRLFGNSLAVFNAVSVTVRNNVAFFCSNKDVLKFMLDKIDKGETLNKDPKFRNTVGHVS
ncbi:MAG: hypothetical protein JWO06_3584, partial [Bacteroidota bacterium]|nr:hypothetical protein [Bacteroidota bacterium]